MYTFPFEHFFSIFFYLQFVFYSFYTDPDLTPWRCFGKKTIKLGAQNKITEVNVHFDMFFFKLFTTNSCQLELLPYINIQTSAKGQSSYAGV